MKLDAIRDCLEGVIPGLMATCAPDGMPNVACLSQVEYVDGEHLALSYQFFNTTRGNILANPQARLIVTHPRTGARYRLLLRYLRTETEGALFERMKAKLAGIASHTGMSDVFRLLGSDVYRVLEIEPVPGAAHEPAPPRSPLAALRAATAALSDCGDLESLINAALDCLVTRFDIPHAMLLMLDGSGTRLYTLASRGYQDSGIGSEIALGEGVIGVAARENAPIRLGHMTAEYAYGRAVRAAAHNGRWEGLETAIPLPGLPESRSQLAVPIAARRQLLGVLYVESPEDLRFGYDDEDALVALAAQLGLAIGLLQEPAEPGELPAAASGAADAVAGAPLTVRRYPENDSIFLDGDYLIRGVAGAILWALLRDYQESRRSVFSNRELRVDPRIRLPGRSDNLEARLILLSRRLVERSAGIAIEKAGRGLLRLVVKRPLHLQETPAP
ncbi:GAF domain-containing protein [Methylogaea oryzae]|uniref:GAF domain-containing protein n=1 Tax=Methylogaea oryzae TaxID=1295382 RepID=A0A8D5AHT6_9GAMM|nr:GAF domain-containing protein [Methylogaea oryzae]BBL70616.1 hypothetical protein MoryE10_12220 [Methylogaea oryzae]